MLKYLFTLCVLAAVMPASGRDVVLENSKAAFRFDSDRGFALCSMKNKETGRSVVFDAAKPLLWQLELIDHQNKTVNISSGKAVFRLLNETRGKSLEIIWTDIPAGQSKVNVKVRCYLQNGHSIVQSNFFARVTGNPAGWIKQVEFPVLRGIKSLGDDYLLVPRYLGRMVRNPGERVTDFHFTHPGKWSMQFIAFHGSNILKNNLVDLKNGFKVNGFQRGTASDETGLFLSTADGQGYHKDVEISRDRKRKGTFNLKLTHYPQFDFWPPVKSRMGVNFSYSMPYPVRLGTYSGGTKKACEIYRHWALKQGWMRRGPVNKPNNPANGVSPKVLNCAFWGKFYHGAGKVVPEMAGLRDYLKVPMNTHWYRYKISKFDDNNLEYFPLDPYFKEGATTLRDMGIGVMPYVCYAVWDLDTESWARKNLIAAAALSESGKPIIWGLRKGHPNAWMNPASQLWRDEFSSLTLKLFEDGGVNGEYLDVMAAASKLCYNDKINKPHGGNYWSRSNRTMLKRLRLETKKITPEAFFTTETFSENYIDLLDAFLTLDIPRYGWRAKSGYDNYPLLSYVYHDYAIPYGSDCHQTLDPAAMRWQMGLSFTWGVQPTYSSNMIYPPESKKAENDRYTREITRAWYQAGAKFLTGGLGIECAQVPDAKLIGQAPVAVISPEHKVITVIKRNDTFPWIGPSVPASAWRGVDGTVGITMTNITDQTIRAKLRLDPGKLNMSGKTLWRSWPLPAKKIKTLSGTETLTLNLAGASVAIYELRDASPPLIRPLEKFDWKFTRAERNGKFKPVTVENQYLWSSKGSIARNLLADGKNRLVLLNQNTKKPRMVKLIKWHKDEGEGKPRHPDNRPFYLYRKTPYKLDGKAMTEVLFASGNVLCARIRAEGNCTLSGPANSIFAVRKGKINSSKTKCALSKGVHYVMAYIPDAEVSAPKGDLTVFLAGVSRQCADKATALMRSRRFLSDLDKAKAEKLYACGNSAALVGANMQITSLLNHDWAIPHLPMPLNFKVESAQKVKASMLSLRPDLEKMMIFKQKHKSAFELIVTSDDAVANLTPVLYRADAGGFTATAEVTVEIDRPLLLETELHDDTLNAVQGGTAASHFKVSNVSPYDLELDLTAVLPSGWSVKYDQTGKSFKLPALSSRTVPFTLTAAADAKGSNDVSIFVNYCRDKVTAVREEFTVSIVPQLLPVKLNNAIKPVSGSPLLRHSGQLAFHVDNDGIVEFKLTPAKYGMVKQTDVAWTLFDGRLRTVRKGVWKPGDKKTLNVKLGGAETGYLAYNGGIWSVNIKKPQYYAFSARKSSPFIVIGSRNSVYTLYFYVPAGAKRFALCGTDGGPSEPAAAELYAPSGKVVFKHSGRWENSAFPVKVSPQDSGGMWKLILRPKQDLRIYLEGDVVPWLSLTPDGGLKYK